MIPVIKLCKGVGEEGKSHCVMAATSIVAGEEFTDRPHCVCPVITACLIRMNDSFDDDQARDECLSHLPWLIIGTRGRADSMIKRAFLFVSWAVEVCGVDFEHFKNNEKDLIEKDIQEDFIAAYNGIIKLQ